MEKGHSELIETIISVAIVLFVALALLGALFDFLREQQAISDDRASQFGTTSSQNAGSQNPAQCLAACTLLNSAYIITL